MVDGTLPLNELKLRLRVTFGRSECKTPGTQEDNQDNYQFGTDLDLVSFSSTMVSFPRSRYPEVVIILILSSLQFPAVISR